MTLQLLISEVVFLPKKAFVLCCFLGVFKYLLLKICSECKFVQQKESPDNIEKKNCELVTDSNWYLNILECAGIDCVIFSIIS